MVPFGVHGLAAANGLASVLQVFLLHRALRRNSEAEATWIPPELWKVLAGSGALLAFLCWIPKPGPEADRTDLLLHLAWIIPVGGGGALGIMAALRFSPFESIIPRFRKRT